VKVTVASVTAHLCNLIKQMHQYEHFINQSFWVILIP